MSFTIDITVVPSSGKTTCVIDKSGKLKCYLKSAAEKGKANRELIELIAKSLRVPQNKIHITIGLTSRKKRITIDLPITFEQFLQAVGIERQLNMFG